ncbi:MAG TPA: flagellar export protein FliJ [Verrucomicrobiae bacterium]|jgi:flagellar export protein FliJ|nr:flagellar export protein FliJ [Verrucomicrobiae bacterium]
MKRFHFSLSALSVLREQQEQAAQKKYSEALRTCEEAAVRVQTASSELSSGWQDLTGKLSAGVSAVDFLRSRAWCNVLELRLKERTAALEQARLKVDAVWQEMLEATRDRESLDRFRAKKRKAYDREAQRREQKEMDELAIQLAATPGPLQAQPQPRV